MDTGQNPSQNNNNISDALSTLAAGADLISYGINLSQAFIIDGIGGIFIILSIFVGPDGPIDGIATVLTLDVALASQSPIAWMENGLGGASLLLTALADLVNHNTNLSEGYVGVDTIVSARSFILGLTPEVNVDAIIGANQLFYDFERANGSRSGGSIPITFDAILEIMTSIGWPIFND
jgi:hypothetical protein